MSVQSAFYRTVCMAGGDTVAVLACVLVIVMFSVAVVSFMQLKRRQWKGAWWAGAALGTVTGILPILSIVVVCIFLAVQPLLFRSRTALRR